MSIVELFRTAPVDPASLEARFASGDIRVMEEIMACFEKGIYQVGLRLFSRPDLAADFCHDVFIRAYEKRRTFNPSKPLKPWIFRVAVNLGRDRLRRRREVLLDDPRIPEPEVAPQSENHLLTEETKALVWKAMQLLPPIYREVLALRFSSDMKIAGIAQALNISLSAAKVRLFRGLKAFEEAFERIGGDADVL